MRVHMGVMTPGCTAVTPTDRVTPLTSPTVVSITRTSGPLMVHGSPSTVVVVIETCPEWITSRWARGRWDPYTEWSPPSPTTTTPRTPRCLAPSMMMVHPRAHHTAPGAPLQGLMAIRIRHTVAGSATVWRPMIAYTEMIHTVVMILGMALHGAEAATTSLPPTAVTST